MHLFSSHGLHFFEIIDMGRRCGLDMPEIGTVYGIEIGEAVWFDERLSEKLEAKVEEIVEIILEDMKP
jgi:Ni,Fe-hydrogenase maturation factor